jgi:4-hydroxyphenylpyruvate dioxygenase-like putative hemolysin
MASPLLPYAENMVSLLTALKEMPFHQDYNESVDDRNNGNSERSESLSALMLILSEQAEHDGKYLFLYSRSRFSHDNHQY